MHSKLWVVDSGASAHFSVDQEYFITLNLSDSGIVSGISVRVRGHGACKLTLVDSTGKRCNVELDGAVYIRDLALRSNSEYLSLLSVPLATNRGCMFEFTQLGDRLWTPEGSVFEMAKSRGLVWLPTIKQPMVTVPTPLLSKQPYYDNIRRRCCHVNDETIRKMPTLGIIGILVNCTHGSRMFCRSCYVAKSTIADIYRGLTRIDDLDIVFTYLL